MQSFNKTRRSLVVVGMLFLLAGCNSSHLEGAKLGLPIISHDNSELLFSYSIPKQGQIYRLATFDLKTESIQAIDLATNYSWHGPIESFDGKYRLAYRSCGNNCLDASKSNRLTLLTSDKNGAPLGDKGSSQWGAAFEPKSYWVYYFQIKSDAVKDQGFTILKTNIETNETSTVYHDLDFTGRPLSVIPVSSKSIFIRYIRPNPDRPASYRDAKHLHVTVYTDGTTAEDSYLPSKLNKLEVTNPIVSSSINKIAIYGYNKYWDKQSDDPKYSGKDLYILTLDNKGQISKVDRISRTFQNEHLYNTYGPSISQDHKNLILLHGGQWWGKRLPSGRTMRPRDGFIEIFDASTNEVKTVNSIRILEGLVEKQ